MSSSLDLKLPAKHLAKRPYDGTLVFDPDGIVFYPTFRGQPEIRIAKNEVASHSINIRDTRTEDVSPLSVYFFGILAFLFPQKSGDVSITIIIRTNRQQVRFLVEEGAIENLQATIDRYLSSTPAR